MAIALDHLIVPTKNRITSAKLLGTLLGVLWAEQGGFGPFSPVYVNDKFTIDFDEWTEPVPKMHYCFRLEATEFDAVLTRIKAAGITYRSLPHGPADNSVNKTFGGKLIYWSEPDGHTWEILTVSYARQSQSSATNGDF